MVTITNIDPTKSISLAPAILNQNFQNIKSVIDSIEGLLKTVNNSLELNGKVTAPANSIECASIILTATTGYLLNGLTDGTTQVFYVDTDGFIFGKKIDLDPAQASTFGAITAYGTSLLKENVTLEKDLSFANNGVIIYKNFVLVITPSNIGNSATSPIDCSGRQEVMLDADNGGSQFAPFGSDVLLKIDKTTLKAGQIFTLRMTRKNSVNDIKLWNGDSSEPLFAKIDYTTGITDIVYTVYPTFDTATAGLSWIRVQYLEVSAGVFRLVVLEYSNMLNV